MPIKDYDGTTYYQIGKVYDYDGTTTYQIGKVYDNDGTSNYLIYSADYELYPENSSALTTYTVGSNQTVTIGSSTLTIQANGQGDDATLYRAAARTSSQINFSNYSSIRIVGQELSCTYGTWGSVGIAAGAHTYIDGYAWGSSGAVITENWAWVKSPASSTNTWKPFDVTYDISNVTGSYYLYFYAYTYFYYIAGLQITRIILE